MTTKTKTYDTHHGLQKVCPCGRARWPKCAHSWYLRWTPPGRTRLQVKLDDYTDQHIETKSAAENVVLEIKAAVKAGTFRSAPDTLHAKAGVDVASDAPMTTARLGELYFASATNKRTGKPLKQSAHDNWRLLCATAIT